MSNWTDKEVDKLESLYPLLPPESLEREFPDRTAEAIKIKANKLGISKVDGYQRVYSVHRSKPIDLDSLDGDFSHFVCGLVSGEGYFTKNEQKHTDSYRFGINLQSEDDKILYKLQDFFGCGLIASERKVKTTNMTGFRVVDLGDVVMKIIPFFDNYPLYNTVKQKQYEKWRKEVLNSVPQGVELHKTTERP